MLPRALMQDAAHMRYAATPVASCQDMLPLPRAAAPFTPRAASRHTLRHIMFCFYLPPPFAAYAILRDI